MEAAFGLVAQSVEREKRPSPTLPPSALRARRAAGGGLSTSNREVAGSSPAEPTQGNTESTDAQCGRVAQSRLTPPKRYPGPGAAGVRAGPSSSRAARETHRPSMDLKPSTDASIEGNRRTKTEDEGPAVEISSPLFARRRAGRRRGLPVPQRVQAPRSPLPGLPVCGLPIDGWFGAPGRTSSVIVPVTQRSGP
jgi:hypothetical protein